MFLSSEQCSISLGTFLRQSVEASALHWKHKARHSWPGLVFKKGAILQLKSEDSL